MIVVCGEALVDLVPAPGRDGYVAHPGGSPANVAAALGRLDVPVSLLARLSTDHFGQLIRAHLAQSHVDLSAAVTTDRRSTVAMVSLGHDGDADYTFAIEGGADDGWRADAVAPLPAAATALHLSGSLALALATMGDALEALIMRERGQRVITVDPNPRPALTGEVTLLRERLERWVRLADIVKISSEDLSWTFPGQSHDEVAMRWLGRDGTQAWALARGGAGARVRGRRPPAELAEALEFPEAVGNELTLRRAFGSLLDRLLARPERAGRPFRKVALSARLVGGGSWRRTVTLRDPTADRPRLRAALGPKLLEIPAPVLELRLEAVELSASVGQQLELVKPVGDEVNARLSDGLRQVRASTGSGSVVAVVEVAPWSRIPEARALFVPRDE